MMFYEE